MKERPPLEAAAIRAVCAYAVEHVILPDDVIRLAVGLRPREPFVIDSSQLAKSFHLGKRYLSILGVLYKGDSTRFEVAAQQVRGRIRVYLAKTREEIECTGSSNNASEIPGTPWFALINNGESRRSIIVESIMKLMGFSNEYIRMVAGLCLRTVAELPSHYSRALSKLSHE